MSYEIPTPARLRRPTEEETTVATAVMEHVRAAMPEAWDGREILVSLPARLLDRVNACASPVRVWAACRDLLSSKGWCMVLDGQSLKLTEDGRFEAQQAVWQAWGRRSSPW